ncbi:MAG: sensor histidine kinase [Mycobacteriales bacterium]
MSNVAAGATVEPRAVATGEPPVRTSLRALWLAGLVYLVASATHPGLHGRHLAAAVLTATSAIGWATWVIARHRRDQTASVVGILVLAVSGGGVVVLHPIGVAVVAVAGMSAASLFDLIPAAAMTVPAVVAAAIGIAITGHSAVAIANAASGAAGGLIMGLGRRQGQQRIIQDAELAMAQERSKLEHERAEVLAERNRLAREVHDVLAHTLSALSVQMEALGSLIDDGAGADEIGEIANRSRRLVTEGLDETRRAVRVLRDEPVDIADQISALADADVTVTIRGEPVRLSASAGLALVRVAQEAVTNARKHAAGAEVAIMLTFDDATVDLIAYNDSTAPSALGSTGAGYGLQGMRERLELVGGSLSAGPSENGWQVHAGVPR